MHYTLTPCFKCGINLERVDASDADSPPYEGTQFRTYGHYGSTFWDSFDGEEIVINICDDCLKKHTDRIAQQKRFEPVKSRMFSVGRHWVDRPMLPFTAERDDTQMRVEPEELGTALPNVEWDAHIEETRQFLLEQERT
jgi:hypothetical protein